MNNNKTGVTEALKARQPPGMPKQDQNAQLHMHKCTCHGKWFMMSNWHVLQVSRFFHFLLIGPYNPGEHIPESEQHFSMKALTPWSQQRTQKENHMVQLLL